MSSPALPSRTVQLRERLSSLVPTLSVPAVATVAVAVAAAVVYAGLARLLKGPHVFGDELYYADAGTSLAQGHGLEVRGEPYGFGPLYPAVLALVRLVAANQSSAYWGWLAVNAVAVGLTAVPAYLLSRRLLDPWWSVGVAAFAVAVPSTFYVGAVMTDALGYLAAVAALYAICLAVEVPTWRRQVMALAAVAVATEVRTQFASLGVTYVLGAAIAWLLRGRPRPSWRRWWPTVGAAASVALFVLLRAAAGRSPSSLLGGYSGLAGGYPVRTTATWAVEHVFDLALYLGMLGGAVAPLAVAALGRAARAGSARHAAFLATLLSATVTAVGVVSAFSATQYGLGRLHDRYLFYVVPLWLVALAFWLAAGAPRTRLLGGASAVGLVVLVLAMPYARLVVPDGAKMFDGAGTAIWATLQDRLATTYGVSGRWALAAAALGAGAWVALVPRRLAWTLVPVVAASFLAGGAIMWKRTIDDSNKGVFADQRAATRSWVDANVPRGARVTLVTVGSPACKESLWRHSFLFTEFFNARVHRVSYVAEPLAVGPPTHELRVASDGTLRTEAGAAVRTPFVVLPHGVRVAGRVVASGTNAPLVLWRTAGPVRLATDRSERDVVRDACR